MYKYTHSGVGVDLAAESEIAPPAPLRQPLGKHVHVLRHVLLPSGEPTPWKTISGFRVLGSGIMVRGSGFRVQGSGFRVRGWGFRVQGPGIRLQGIRFLPFLSASPLASTSTYSATYSFPVGNLPQNASQSQDEREQFIGLL